MLRLTRRYCFATVTRAPRRSLQRKEPCQLQSHLPFRIGERIRMNDGVVRGSLAVERLTGILEDPPQAKTERNGPSFMPIQLPVRCDVRRTREVPAFHKIVV